MRTVPPTSIESIIHSIWLQLFQSPIHLDSAISKIPSKWKPLAARVLGTLLRRPATTAFVLGVSWRAGEPWACDGAALQRHGVVKRLIQGVARDPDRLEHREGRTEDFPPEMVAEWSRDWGKPTSGALVKALSLDPPLSLRASRSKGSQALLEVLGREVSPPAGGMNASRISPVGVRLGGYVSIGESTPFKEGWCEIQDEGSQFMALFAIWPEIYGEYLQERPGDSLEATIPEPPRGRSLGYHVIDTCAGAGGKSLAMADFLEGRGRVFSYDISEVKLRALKKRAKRAQIQNIQTLQVQDGQEEMIGEKFRGSADRVLVDAPCTGWGVLRRNPDIKWRQSESELLRLPTLQRRILSGYSSLVRKGGFLTYGVCTFRRAETLDVVEHFLLRHSEFRLIKQGFLGPTSSDGFFMAAFQRDKE